MTSYQAYHLILTVLPFYLYYQVIMYFCSKLRTCGVDSMN